MKLFNILFIIRKMQFTLNHSREPSLILFIIGTTILIWISVDS